MDYNYYKNTYLGTFVTDEEFPRLLLRAEAYMSKYIKEIDLNKENHKLALCSIIDAWKGNEVGYSTSETVGSWSRTIKVEDKSNDDRLYNAMMLYLSEDELIGGGKLSVRWC